MVQTWKYNFYRQKAIYFLHQIKFELRPSIWQNFFTDTHSRKDVNQILSNSYRIYISERNGFRKSRRIVYQSEYGLMTSTRSIATPVKDSLMMNVDTNGISDLPLGENFWHTGLEEEVQKNLWKSFAISCGRNVGQLTINEHYLKYTVNVFGTKSCFIPVPCSVLHLTHTV